MTKQRSYKRRMVAIIASKEFFWGIIALLVLQAVWIALSGRYPMAFDEDFHLGIIRLYAHHLSPFLNGQPPGADAFGAVARDPSYLYHYLMSFPYRLISAFTNDQAVQVLFLRAINISLFAVGLAIYRRLLLKTGASRAIVHICLLAFVLIPVAPLLAAQINYDNLFLPLVGLALLWTVDISTDLGRHRRADGRRLLQLAVLCLLASLVKYAFLPIFLAVVIYLAVCLVRTFKSWQGVWSGLSAGMKSMGPRSGLLLAAALVVACALFGQRYGVNLVRYHTPIPDCGKVLSVEACSDYGPWIRDYNYSINNLDEEHNPAVFTADWFYGMWLRLFFAVDGPGTHFQTRGPLLVPSISAIAFAAAGAALALGYGRRIFRLYDSRALSLLLLVSVLYIAVLWLDNFRSYVRTGHPAAINGRYLLPVLPPLILLGALGANEFCRRWEGLKLLMAGTAVVCLVWGGGALTYILRSNDKWYWPNSPLVGANQAIQRDLGPLVPGYNKPTEFMGHHGT